MTDKSPSKPRTLTPRAVMRIAQAKEEARATRKRAAPAWVARADHVRAQFLNARDRLDQVFPTQLGSVTLARHYIGRADTLNLLLESLEATAWKEVLNCLPNGLSVMHVSRLRREFDGDGVVAWDAALFAAADMP